MFLSENFASFLGANTQISDVEINQYMDLFKAKMYLENKRQETEIVDVMFAYSERYAKSMKKKKYRILAAICILDNKNFNGCEYFNKQLNKAKMHFLKDEYVDMFDSEGKIVEKK